VLLPGGCLALSSLERGKSHGPSELNSIQTGSNQAPDVLD
jgi:hypothetical protein